MNDGKHQGGFKYRNARDKSHRGRNSIIGTIFTAITGTVIKDLTSGNSKIKKIFKQFPSNKKLKDKPEIKHNQIDEKEIIDTEYKNVVKGDKND
ncbi:MAG: hypothetical protein U9R41_06575 [Candidatus Marinimicrobia bacterium]|nr:hypothetical protein [Candidatus Neomarinimicrobiota bacterium]